MSTEQSVDPELVEQAKQQIRGLAREVAQLAKSDIAPLEFYDAMLNRVVTALAAVGGAVWTIVEGRLELQYQINLRETRITENEENQRRHGLLLNKALGAPEGMIVSPRSGAGDDSGAANPTDLLLVLGALKAGAETRGLVEIFQRPSIDPKAQRGYLGFVLQMCELAGDFLKNRELRHFSDRQTLWAQLENFTRLAHRNLDVRSTAYTIANEGRRLIDCDRVSVAIGKGKRGVIEAVSGQDLFDKRSNIVTLLGELATAVMHSGETVWYTGDTTHMPPQIEEAVQAYIDEAHSKAVGIIPLKRPQDPPASPDEVVEPPEVIGALVVEQIQDSQPKQGLQQRVDVVREHSAIALANALEHRGLFLMPVWEKLGKAKWVVQARTLPKTIAIAVTLLTAIVLMCVVPWSFYLSGKGTLQPSERRDVFAWLDGVVVDVKVKHGQAVKKGELLAVMRNTDLEVNYADIAGQKTSTQEQINSIRRSLLDERNKLSDEERIRLSGQLLQLKKTYDSLVKQLELLKQKREQLNVLSPIDGLIVTWDVHNLLIHRPVRQGQVLMSIADPSGDWELELHMPEERIGHIVAAQQRIKPELMTKYILATDPGNEHFGSVKEVGAKAEPSEEEGNTVLVRVAINKNDFEERRPGSTVNAKVNCGYAPIGYVWFHDLIAWVQTKVIFPFF